MSAHITSIPPGRILYLYVQNTVGGGSTDLKYKVESNSSGMLKQ